MVQVGPDALKFCVLFLVIGVFCLLAAAFNIDLSNDDDDYVFRRKFNPQWNRAKGLLFGIPFTFFGVYGLVEYAVVTHRNHQLLVAQHRSNDPIGEGWKHEAVKLYGETFWNAAVASDGSVFALTGKIKANASGSWLYHLDPKGRFLSAFGEDGVASVYDYAPVARALAYDETHHRIYIASSVDADVQEDVSIYELDESGSDHPRAAELTVARPKSSPGVATSGNVALSVGADGKLIAVIRADSPGPDGSQLAAYRIDWVSGVESGFGGALVKLPTDCGVDGDLSLARGPQGELYVATADGLHTWVMRLGDDGHLDTSFGKDGLVQLDQPGYSTMIATPSGVVVAGNGGGYRLMMRRVGYDGTVDEEFAKTLRAHPLALREKELTHVCALAASATGSVWVELSSLDRASGRGVSALLRFSESGEEEGGPVYLEDQVPQAPSVLGAGIWPLGDERLLAAIVTGPAIPSSAKSVPEMEKQIYVRPLEIPDLIAAAARAPAIAPSTGSDAQPDPQEAQGAEDEDAGAPVAAAEPSAPTVPNAPSEPAPAAPDEKSAVFYTYTDHGVVHIVSSLEKVPAALRSTAHPVR